MKYVFSLTSLLALAGADTSLRGHGRDLAPKVCGTAKDCHNHGVCLSGICRCGDGWAGDGYFSCADINECKFNPNPCSSDGMYCVDHDPPLKYECGCRHGWEKVLPTNYDNHLIPIETRPIRCEDVNECTSHDPKIRKCDENAACSNSDGSYSCECFEGFSGDGFECERDALNAELLLPCAEADCKQDSQVCVVNGDTAQCHCKPGFIAPAGVGAQCQDLNECENGTNDCHPKLGNCINSPGSFSCECKPGYSGDGRTCVDIDECVTGARTCAVGLMCHNTIGASFCAKITSMPSASPSLEPSATPSLAPSVTPFCSVPNGTICGSETTPFDCSCDNSCGILENCCPDFETACADYDFETGTVDTQFQSDGLDFSANGTRTGHLRCNGAKIGRGTSDGCGFNLGFNTLGGSTSDLTCDCLELEMVDPSGADFLPPTSVKVYFNGALVLSLPETYNTSFSAGNYTMDCSLFSRRRKL